MPTVKFLPVDVTCKAEPGDSLLDVALNNDVPLQHACGGFCSCTTCHVHVKSGAEFLESMDEEEDERIASVDRKVPESRLGCQARLKAGGEVVVEIMNLD
ncbi:MAG: 2Fe-2S iron-sulfur cluster binding domain-containing protein [Bdellovibrionales bacterium]|nr:2Fe-2S iron-sulfur cluster binding domain-containing protein [Bdellovibrionales bacterium]